MKFATPSGSTTKVAIAATGGAIVGGMGSRAVIGLIHNPTETSDTTQQKKNNNMLLVKQGIVAAAGIGLAAAIQGSDATSAAVQGAGVGMAVVQGLEIIKTLANKSGQQPANGNSSTAKKVVSDALGLSSPLGCPAPLNAPRRRRALNAPVYDAPAFETEIVTGTGEDWSVFGFGGNQLNLKGI
nr:hypothetical protein [uncultured Flavobacterium sp.]